MPRALARAWPLLIALSLRSHCAWGVPRRQFYERERVKRAAKKEAKEARKQALDFAASAHVPPPPPPPINPLVAHGGQTHLPRTPDERLNSSSGLWPRPRSRVALPSGALTASPDREFKPASAGGGTDAMYPWEGAASGGDGGVRVANLEAMPLPPRLLHSGRSSTGMHSGRSSAGMDDGMRPITPYRCSLSRGSSSGAEPSQLSPPRTSGSSKPPKTGGSRPGSTLAATALLADGTAPPQVGAEILVIPEHPEEGGEGEGGGAPTAPAAATPAMGEAGATPRFPPIKLDLPPVYGHFGQLSNSPFMRM